MGLENALVCDDQALLEIEDGALVARTPEAIEGKIELRGHGIISIPSIRSCSVCLIVRMIEDENVQRMPDCTTTELLGTAIPMVIVPVRHEQASVRIVFAWLKDNGYLD